MRVKVKRLFRDGADFVRELKKTIIGSGVHVRVNHHWPIFANGVFIDLAVPDPSRLDPILFAIECKAYKGQTSPSERHWKMHDRPSHRAGANFHLPLPSLR